MAEQLADNRTIDDLCATQIMGWSRSSPGYAVPVHGHLSQVIDADKWRPSTRIEDAWRLLEKFPALKFYVCLVATVTGNWRCDIYTRGGHGPVVSANDKSAARAITLACLAAVGHPIAPLP